MATGHLKLPPSEFWGMTPMEVEALCEATNKANPKYVEPVSQDEAAALMAKFPDRKK